LTWILHLSDPHLGDVAAWQKLDQAKISTPQEDLATTQSVVRRTLASLREYIAAVGAPDAVVISGDLTWRHQESGFAAFAELLDEYADVFPDPANIVVVPGNHDVDWNVEPGLRCAQTAWLSGFRPATERSSERDRTLILAILATLVSLPSSPRSSLV
jgi:3',5'-cyclic AMP phosphodiesterase CpdA